MDYIFVRGVSKVRVFRVYSITLGQQNCGHEFVVLL